MKCLEQKRGSNLRMVVWHAKKSLQICELDPLLKKDLTSASKDWLSKQTVAANKSFVGSLKGRYFASTSKNWIWYVAGISCVIPDMMRTKIGNN